MRCPKCNGLLTSTREEEYCVNCGKRTQFFTKIDYDTVKRHEFQEKLPRNICSCGNSKSPFRDSCTECRILDNSLQFRLLSN